MTTLVTGATGFAGINIVRALAKAGEKVVALDTVSASHETRRYISDLQDKINFVIGDVSDTETTLRLAKETDVKRIVHAAAITPPRDVELSMPSHVVNVNLMGTVNMLDVARTISAERFVFVSSSGVYGAPKDNTQFVTEEANTQPGNLYGICKLACELLMKRYKQLFGLSTVVGRMAAIYGPMERITASRGNPSLIYKLMHAQVEQTSEYITPRSTKRNDNKKLAKTKVNNALELLLTLHLPTTASRVLPTVPMICCLTLIIETYKGRKR